MSDLNDTVATFLISLSLSLSFFPSSLSPPTLYLYYQPARTTKSDFGYINYRIKGTTQTGYRKKTSCAVHKQVVVE